MKIAATSGGLGDIVYAIPIMKQLGVTRLYVKVSYYFVPYGNLYLAIKRLLEQQGIEVLPTDGSYFPHTYDPAIKFDYDLDAARRQPLRGKNHIIVSYLNQYGLSHDNWWKPWLTVTGERFIEKRYVLVHRTSRWRRRNTVDWRLLIADLKDRYYDSVYFIGFNDEYDSLCQETGIHINHFLTTDVLQLALLVRDCDQLWCNQSVALTLAQGLGKQYTLERNADKTNCLTYTDNESIIYDKIFPNAFNTYQHEKILLARY